MEMVKLKMRTIYKSFLSFIAFLIVVASTLGIAYLFYDKVLESASDIEVTGALSINYMDGKIIDVATEETIRFSITNSGDNVIYYNIGFLQVRGNGSYKLKYGDTIINEGELKSIDEISTDYVSIDIGETKVYSLEIYNNSDKNLKGILNIRNKEGKTITFADTILNNIPASESALTKVGDEIAIENEGLIKSFDDIGVSYYFRGNVINNYVSFANLTWRIVRINGDGTVRMVLDGVTDSLTTYYNENNGNFSYNNSTLESYLNSWFELNLTEYTDYIANTKFCNDINHDELYNYNSYVRIITNKIPTLNCLGNSFSSNIGAMTIDEVVLAGANTTNSNQSYYLYNPNIGSMWYTMTGAKGTENSINMFMVDENGKLLTTTNGNLYRNIRPVINLIKNTEVIGNGTIEEPYRILEK